MRFALLLLVVACKNDAPDDANEDTTDPAEDHPVGDLTEADLDGEGAARRWATASAPNVFVAAYAPVLMAEAAQLEGDACPRVTEEATSTVYEGDCTSQDGTEWFGRVVIDLAGVTYESFGFRGESDACPGERDDLTFEGSLGIGYEAGGAMGFDIDVAVDGTSWDDTDCSAFTGSSWYLYEGQLLESGDEEIWSGSGTLGDTESGRVEARTVDEVIDGGRCSYEALSGTTTVSASGQEIAYLYDGATDCDPEATVQWSLDGELQGELTGVACSSVGSAPTVGGLFALLALIGRLRRQPPSAGLDSVPVVAARG